MRQKLKLPTEKIGRAHRIVVRAAIAVATTLVIALAAVREMEIATSILTRG